MHARNRKAVSKKRGERRTLATEMSSWGKNAGRGRSPQNSTMYKRLLSAAAAAAALTNAPRPRGNIARALRPLLANPSMILASQLECAVDDTK